MAIQLTSEGLRKIFPSAPQDIIDAFVAKQDVLAAAGISHTRTRLAYFFANIEHECGGFTIKNLTENIAYTAERMAQVWPNRFSGAAAVRAKYGTAPGWQRKAFDDIYGNRMGNRPGTHDGSTYIGRGGPQWTGRDGYAALQARTGLPAVADPDVVSRHDMQPEVCAAFWVWKDLNKYADGGDLRGCRKAWNGGYNGMADVEARLNGNDPYIKVLREVDRVVPVARDLPGDPPTPAPPKEIIAAATEKERRAAQGGGAIATAGGAAETASQTAGTVQPGKSPEPLVSPLVTYAAIGIGVAVLAVGIYLIWRKRQTVIANWF